MRKAIFLIIILNLLFGINLSQSGQKANYKIIINSSNPDSVMTKEEVSKYFLKKIKKWEMTDEKVLPVDLVEDSKVRKFFSDEILQKKITSVKAYWQKQIFSGRGVPPPEKKTDQDILEYVHENEGAIGYISKEAKMDEYQVKIVEIKEEERRSRDE